MSSVAVIFILSSHDSDILRLSKGQRKVWENNAIFFSFVEKASIVLEWRGPSKSGGGMGRKFGERR